MNRLRKLRKQRSHSFSKKASRLSPLKNGLRAGQELTMGAPFVAITANESFGRPIEGEDLSWAANQTGDAINDLKKDDKSRRSRMRNFRQRASR